jgi:hypothetical protein
MSLSVILILFKQRSVSGILSARQADRHKFPRSFPAWKTPYINYQRSSFRVLSTSVGIPQFKAPFILSRSAPKKFRAKVTRRKYSKSFLSRLRVFYSSFPQVSAVILKAKKA